jgi:hypothetical protein
MDGRGGCGQRLRFFFNAQFLLHAKRLRHTIVRQGDSMLDGLFEPMHLLVGVIVLCVFGIPFFLICRWLWNKGSKTPMKIGLLAIASLLALGGVSRAQNATLADIRHVNEWCKHCPDWNQTLYSFKVDGGRTYVGTTHAALDIALHGRVTLRFDRDGRVGDHMHVIDDHGKYVRLKITEKIAP